MVIKFMSSDFFVWCFIVVNCEEIWTRPYLDVMVWRTKYNKKWSISTLREKYINWNWLDQAWGRFLSMYEMICLSTRCEVLRLASKCWNDDLNEICWCASFVCWPELVQVLHLLRSFLKIFVRTSPGAFDVLKVDVLNLLTSPGAFEIFCQVFSKWIVQDFLTARY